MREGDQIDRSRGDDPIYYPIARRLLTQILSQAPDLTANRCNWKRRLLESDTFNGFPEPGRNLAVLAPEASQKMFCPELLKAILEAVDWKALRKDGTMATQTMQPTPTHQPSLPDLTILAVPADQILLFRARARGVQIYPCDPKTHSFGPSRPEAILVTDQGDIIHHDKGPTDKGPKWTAADGSHVIGTVLQKVAAPDPDAVPWLLLSTTPGGTPKGMLSSVSFIQRVYTKAGNPPSGACGSDGRSETPVIYEAEYYFYGRKDWSK